ncbi:hypothetical protein [Nakamurella deserti]|uniref:hypothetical protein n=1 Tax=Nakamurella deserti TaxID=2164074 RepID=UPI000DBE3F57|nr:hypothetical protein [Nakamurella deserti]
MAVPGSSADEDDELPVDVRIAAALTLTTDTPSATALALLDDRRIAAQWSSGLLLAGFVLLAVLALLSGRADGTGPTVLTAGALAVALGGGLRRWRIERARSRARTADAALPRAERLLLLAGIHRGRQANRIPVPLLRELARWRADAAVPELLMLVGASTALYLPGWQDVLSEVSGWRIVGAVVLVGALALLVGTTLRERARCRRFLADSAGWGSAGGDAATAI